MAVTEIIETHEGRRGREEITGVREYERVFKVITDSVYDGPKVVKSAFGIPKYGEFYKTTNEFDEQAFLMDKNADQIDDSKLAWLVTCTFSTLTNNGNGGLELPVEPLSINSTLEWGFVEYRKIAVMGINQQTKEFEAITNSAKDVFDPPLEMDAARLALRITRNEASFNPIVAYRYANAINSDDWNVMGYVFPKRTAMMKPPRAVLKNQRGQMYWEVSYEFHFAFETWNLKVLDTGVREFLTENEAAQRNSMARAANNGKPAAVQFKAGYSWIRNDDGTYVSEPVLLDGEGKAAYVPGRDKDLRNIRGMQRVYGVYTELPFSPLRLP